MKKTNFITLILGTIGGVFFSLGMCMALLPEWNMRNQGIGCGIAGMAILVATLLFWRKMEGKAPVRISRKTVGAVMLGVVGALLLGTGMSLAMVFSQIVIGTAVGLIGIAVLLLLIPVCKELR